MTRARATCEMSSVPVEVYRIVETAIARGPDDCFQSAAEGDLDDDALIGSARAGARQASLWSAMNPKLVLDVTTGLLLGKREP